MDGLIIRLLEDKTCAPGRWFWKIFRPIRPDLDRMYWYFNGQPWMGWPVEFDYEAELLSISSHSVSFWRPGALGKYADQFCEEYIELWAFEPTRDHPSQWVAESNGGGRRAFEAFEAFEATVEQKARIWLIYTACTCWEIYARKSSLIDRVRTGLQGKRWATVHRSESDRRAQFLGDAGLSHT